MSDRSRLRRRLAAIGAALRRARAAIPIDVLTDAAAALTYYAVLSLLPGLALLISALALVGSEETARSVIEAVNQVAPESVGETLEEPIESLFADEALSGAALALGAAISLYSASRYVAAFGRASDRIQGVEPGEVRFWRRRPLAMLLVVAIVVLLPLALMVLLITGPIAVALAEALGISSTLRELIAIVRWPLLAAVGVVMLAILYLSSARMRQAGVRGVVPGAILAIGVWLVSSALFSAFVANLTSFSLTYGSLAGFVIFLIWLYITNLAALAGMVLNVMRLPPIHGREPRAGRSRARRPSRRNAT